MEIAEFIAHVAVINETCDTGVVDEDVDVFEFSDAFICNSFEFVILPAWKICKMAFAPPEWMESASRFRLGMRSSDSTPSESGNPDANPFI